MYFMYINFFVSLKVPSREAINVSDIWKQDQLKFTAFPPQELTALNGSYTIGLKLKG